MEQPDPKHYNDFLQNSIQILDARCSASNCRPKSWRQLIARLSSTTRSRSTSIASSERRRNQRRKQIEANGIAAFQRTVSEGISDSYLRWRGIEATLALAQSKNSKIVIIGGGKDGLPIILGNVDNVAGSSSRATAVDDDVIPNEKLSTTSPGNTLVKPATGAPLTGTDKTSAAAISSTPPDVTQANSPKAPEKGPTSYSPIDLSQFKTFVPRLPEWLHLGTSGTGSGTGTPKQ